jgi:maltose-binding protein MalE
MTRPGGFPQRNPAALLAAAAVAGLVLCAVACAPRPDAATRLSLWEQMDPAQQAVLARQLTEFERLHPGVTVETNHFETDKLRTQFQTAGLAGAGPDLVYGPSDQVGPFSIMGLILPLEGLVDPDTLKLFVEAARPGLSGHVYALADQVGNHLTLVYNKALVHEPATDTDLWLRQAKELTRDLDGDGRIDRYGIVMNLTEPFWLVPWLGGFGGWVMDEQGRPTLDTPAQTQALEFMRSIAQSGVIPPNCDYPLMDTLFKQGAAAYAVNGPWSWQSYRDAGIDVGLAVLPRISQSGLYPTPMTAALGYSMSVHVPPARRALVLELLTFLTSARKVAEVSRSLGALPSRIDVAAWPDIAGNAMLHTSWEQLRRGRPMPIVPEMRVIWDVMRTAYQQVLGGAMSPQQAPAWMQAQAVRKIEELRL